MLKKTIVVHKERVVVPPPLQQQRSSVFNNVTNRMSRDEYEQYLKNQPFPVGALVTLISTAQEAYSLHQFSIVTYIENDFDKVYWDGYSGLPKCYHLVQLKDNDSWQRYDTASGYRFPTEKELQTIIKPNHDKVQNYRKQYIRQEAASPF